MSLQPSSIATLSILSAGSETALPRWYALYTRSNYEKQVVQELTSKGIENYLPTVKEIHQWKDRKKAVEVPVFRSYVFTRFIDTDSWRLRVLRTSGAVRILGGGNGGTIEPISDVKIESVRRLVNSNLPFAAYPFLREGVRVRVKRGPLKGTEGRLVRFKGQARLILSIEILAQSVAAEVDPTDVEICP